MNQIKIQNRENNFGINVLRKFTRQVYNSHLVLVSGDLLQNLTKFKKQTKNKINNINFVQLLAVNIIMYASFKGAYPKMLQNFVF